MIALGLLSACGTSSASPAASLTPTSTVAGASTRTAQGSPNVDTSATSTLGPTASPPPIRPASSTPSPDATPPAASESPPAPAIEPASSPSPTGDIGYLEGRATIGPLTPVEQVGVPTPTPSPEVCTARGLIVYESDGKTEVTSFDLRLDCTYRVALKPGTYVVQLQRRGIDSSMDLPKTVAISAGKTTRLDMHIDTGIR